MLEVNGFIGNTDALMAPLSRERGVASHYHGVGLDRFSWWVGGVLELGFEAPTLAAGCFGVHPDQYVEHMTGAGFVIDGSLQGPDHSAHAAFALAERLTGVGVTESLLATADFEWGYVQTVH
jgi:hypothetical protein